MATIRKHQSGRYEAIIRRKDFPHVSKYFSSKREANEWAAVQEAKMVTGEWADLGRARKMTLAEALERYAREVTPKKSGPETELSRIRRWLAHPLAKKTLARIRSEEIAEYRDARLAAGKAGNTVRLELNLLSAVFTKARKSWKMSRLSNPVADVDMPELNPGRTRRIERIADGDELDLILAQTTSPHLPAIVQLAVETAMRRSELVLALRWRHVDLDKRTAYLPKTKNGDSRVVPLSSKAVALLRNLPRLDARVFPIKPASVTQAFRRACEKARALYEQQCAEMKVEPDPEFLCGLVFHDTRHEATTRLSEKLTNVLELSAVTGHRDLRMLKRYYHPRPEELALKLG